MTQVTISRDTLFWRDQIIKLRELVSKADAAWLAIAVLPNTSGTVQLKEVKRDLKTANESLAYAVSTFADLVFIDLLGVK